MSNLSSLVDILRGWPNGSALATSFKEKAGLGAHVTEGQIVDVEAEGVLPVIDLMTSSLIQNTNASSVSPDHPWLVVQGKDQWDADTADKSTCIKLRTGIVFKVASALEHNVGDLVYSNAGIVTSCPAHATAQIGVTGVFYSLDRQSLGQAIEVNHDANYVVVAS
jgi:hypothetical protein